MKTQEENTQDTKQKHGSDQRDAGLAAENRPVPSQAEGDEETVDADLKHTGKNR